jgi:hypothetical protein
MRAWCSKVAGQDVRKKTALTLAAGCEWELNQNTPNCDCTQVISQIDYEGLPSFPENPQARLRGRA